MSTEETNQYPIYRETAPANSPFAPIGWPHAPTKERLIPAMQVAGLLIEDLPIPKKITPDEADDVMQMLVAVDTKDFGDNAVQAYIELVSELPPGQDRNPELTAITASGTSKHAVGVIIEQPSDRTDTPVPYSQKTFTRLNRHPDWTGYNPNLPMVKDTIALILENPEMPGDIAIVSCSFVGIDQSPLPQNATTEHPEGLPQRIRDILLWHGAKSCHWIPATAQESPT